MCIILKPDSALFKYSTQYSSDGFSIMSLILTLTGKSNILATTFPAIDLSDDDYESNEL